MDEDDSVLEGSVWKAMSSEPKQIKTVIDVDSPGTSETGDEKEKPAMKIASLQEELRVAELVVKDLVERKSSLAEELDTAK